VPTLANTQLLFRNALVCRDAASITPLLVAGPGVKQRLAIHQRNYEMSLINALHGLSFTNTRPMRHASRSTAKDSLVFYHHAQVQNDCPICVRSWSWNGTSATSRLLSITVQ
jgi:hypothetical protein